MPDEPIACVGVPTWNLTNVCASARARMPRAEHNDEPLALAARSLLREAGTSNVTCSLAAATRRLQLDFVFVGLEEEFFLSIQALEAILPRWFRNATQTLAQTGTLRQGSMRNPLTNTTMLGSVSRTTRQILEKHALGYANEVKFYETAKRLFWSRVALAVLPLPPRPTLSREHYLQSARTEQPWTRHRSSWRSFWPLRVDSHSGRCCRCARSIVGRLVALQQSSQEQKPALDVSYRSNSMKSIGG